MTIETELKLQLPLEHGDPGSNAILDRLQSRPHPRGSTRRLKSTYFDTPECDLANRGMALRVRESGNRLTQTLKAPVPGRSGLQVFREYEAELSGRQPSILKIGNRTLAAALRREIWPRLRPLFETDIERTAWRLPFRGSEIEVALDRGCIRAGDREEPVRELEIELKSGPRSALYAAAEELLEAIPFRVGHNTKAARGYALAAGENAQVQKATVVDLRGANTAADALERIVAECLAQMQANEAAILASGDKEAIHQFRVALRRLRAVIGACRDLIDDAVYATWAIDLRWALRSFGPARDYDVFVTETLDQMLPHIPDEPHLAQFVNAAQAARAKARRGAILSLDNPRYAAMQLHFYRALDSGSWRRGGAGGTLRRSVRAFAASKLRERYKRLRRLGDRWQELSVPELHRLRIQAKKLRYVTTAFSSLFKGKPARRFGERLGGLQDCLGVLNDGYVGAQLAREIAEIAATNEAVPVAELQRIRGLIEGWHARAIHDRLGQLEQVWTEFAKAERFWRA